VGPVTVQPPIVSLTVTVWKNPVPVALTWTVKSTDAPEVGTAVGFADLVTVMEYVGGAAIATEAAIDRSPAAANTAASLVRLVMVRNLSLCAGPDWAMDESGLALEWVLLAQG
jgi:hypothetical protein